MKTGRSFTERLLSLLQPAEKLACALTGTRAKECRRLAILQNAAAFHEQQPALRTAVSEAIDAMIADGTIDRLSKRWVGVDYDMAAEIQRARRQQ